MKLRYFQESLWSHDLHFIFEAVLYFIILSVLAGISIHYYSQYLRVSSHVATLSSVNPIKTDIYYAYANTGKWMSAKSLADFANYDDDSMSDLGFDASVDKGNIIIRYDNDHQLFPGQILVLRKATFPQQLAAPTIWLCAYQTTPTHAQVDSTHKNTVLIEDLPKGCKP